MYSSTIVKLTNLLRDHAFDVYEFLSTLKEEAQFSFVTKRRYFCDKCQGAIILPNPKVPLDNVNNMLVL